ncbi:MAG: terminase large subunit [Hyphomicrobiaceae bacterium]|nr:terminase large subunit [Hyphomicrobiaceae bacterium]MCC0024620.1 terminase large subunit [Hyphomicrobiaceae bacterium]
MSSWNFACPDWERRLSEGRTLVPDLPLIHSRAQQAVDVFNRLRLPDVPGQPSMAKAAGDWFRDIVRAVFGSLDDEGVRHVQECFALVPKKNSKTTGGAGIMLTALLLNVRPRAEFLLVGPTQEIADLAFQQAAGMIEADPDGYLQRRFLVQEHKKTIRDRLTKASLKIKTFDMKVMTGAKPAGVLLDEIHIMSSLSYASKVVGQIRGGLLPNPEAFMIIITTQSDDPPRGVFKAELQYARKVRDGKVSEASVLPILYEFPERIQTGKDEDWRDPSLWPMVLPNLNRSITIDRLIADFRVAEEKGQEEVRRWASQHLNIEIGLALHSERWRGADYWEQAADPALSGLETLLERCEVAVAGIDGGGLDDLLGLAIVGREKQTNRWLAWGYGFAQTDVLELRKEIAESLRDFEKDGDLTFCEIGTGDIEHVAEIVERVRDRGLFPEKYAVGFDPQGIAAMVDELAERGIDGDLVVSVPQGYRLSNAIWGAERKLKDGTLLHGGQPMMAWCVGNAKAEQRGNAVLITKETAGKAKIDPLIAFFNAFSLMARNPVAAVELTSPWDDPEFSLVA